MISSLASKCQDFKVEMPFFQPLYVMKLKTSKSLHFEASKDIITKFKSQGLYTIKIRYWSASGSGFPPTLIPALRKIGLLHHKKAKLPKHLQHSVCCFWFESWLLPFFISVVRRFWRQWSSCHFPTESTACGTDCINWFNLYNFGHFDRKVRIIQKNMKIVKNASN